VETIGLVRVLAGRDPLTANRRGESGPKCSARARYPHEHAIHTCPSSSRPASSPDR
jgi:hypothetical protein